MQYDQHVWDWAEYHSDHDHDFDFQDEGYNPFEAANVTFADNPPVDPLRRAAKALCFAAKLTPSQLIWSKSHDWFDSIVDGALIVTDSFTYKGRSYEERIIWAGTFAELRDWAGY